MLVKTPEPPYVAIIFTNRKSADAGEDYAKTAARMVELAHQQDGFLGFESATGEDGLTISMSYWRDEAAARAWKQNAEHLAAQKLGRETWYQAFSLRVATVSRAYDFERK
jgi:heme-degrading monooxygenase HmoA